jgi:hypothetical protein
MVGLASASAAIDGIIAHGRAAPGLRDGALGAGKTVLAERLALAWLCPKADTSGGCRECQVCRTFLDSGKAIDLQRIEPLGPSRIVRVGQIVADSDLDWEGTPATVFLQMMPTVARNRVVLIQDVDRMNQDAANALLKTLEEAGNRARLILTTSAISRVLPTIRSRCITIACELPGEDELTLEFGALEPHEVLFSEGAPGVVRQIREVEEAYRLLYALFEELPAAPIGAALVMAERFREAAEVLEKPTGQGSRACHAEALRCLALWIRHRMPGRPDRLAAVVETHRRVVGNANASLAFDPLFAILLGA